MGNLVGYFQLTQKREENIENCYCSFANEILILDMNDFADIFLLVIEYKKKKKQKFPALKPCFF